ncbi:hypothetical protein JCM16163A_30840 [Paenibacillus sp. YK5]
MAVPTAHSNIRHKLRFVSFSFHAGTKPVTNFPELKQIYGKLFQAKATGSNKLFSAYALKYKAYSPSERIVPNEPTLK